MLGPWSQVWAQEPTSFLEQLVTEEREREEALEAERLRLQPFALEFGGWYRFSYFWFEYPGGDQLASNDRNLRNHDLRFWLSANLEDIHYVYTRFRVGFIDFSPGDSFDSNDYDTEGINLDMAFYRLNLTQALRHYCDLSLPLTTQVQAGRQYFNVGTGLEADVITLYRHLANAAGTDLAPEHGSAKPGEQLRSVISPQLAAQVLGWKATVPLEEGLRITYRAFAG